MVRKIGLYHDKRNKGKPWVVRWFGEYDPGTGKAKRHTKGFRLKVEAETFKRKKAEEFDNGLSRDGLQSISLGNFLDKWLNSRKLRPESVKLYQNTIIRLKAYFGEDVKLGKIRPYQAESFIAEIRPWRGKQLSPWTRHRILRQCKTIFQTAVTWEFMVQNPFAKMRGPKCRPSDWYYMPPDEYLTLLDAAPSLRYKATYALAYTCGLRFGELFNLTWDDIDLHNRELRIRNRQGKPDVPEFCIKDYEQRTITLPENTAALLEDLKAYNELTDQTPYVCLDRQQYDTAVRKWKAYYRQGRAWRNQDMVNNAGREFRRHVRKAGIEPTASLSLHTLRKCAGKNWAMVNRDPSVTQRLMGHSSIVTTMKYYDQVTTEDRVKAAAAIDALLAQTE